MAIPKLHKVGRITFALDGGTHSIYISDESGEMHCAVLVQHMLPQNSTVGRRFGRLYFDDRLIEVRSDDEGAILNFLRVAADQANTYPSYVDQIREVVTFVQSDEYVQLADHYSKNP